MIVQCPKCKTKLKVDETRIKPEGSRMKCPRCTVVLLVRPPKQPAQTPRPAPAPPKPDRAAPPRPAPAGVSLPPGSKVLVAHGNPAILSEAVGLLMGAGCTVSTAPDGVEAMVKAQQEVPDVALIDVALPKIYGFEVARRLREQEQTEGIRVLLITSVHKEDRYRREPQSLYGADGYVEEPLLKQKLLREVAAVLAKKPSGASERKTAPAAAPRAEASARQAPESGSAAPTPGGSQQDRDRAQRLSRTILSDIELYSPAKAAEAIRDGNFETVFADELAEGRKLYDARVSPATRAEKDFYKEAIGNYIRKKEENL